MDFWSKSFDSTSISVGQSCIKLGDYINHRLLKTFTATRNTISSFVLLVHDFLPWDMHQNLVHFEVWKITIGIPRFNLVTFVFSF
jgi:hypothetical protein